jgi:hypothetical protein
MEETAGSSTRKGDIMATDTERLDFLQKLTRGYGNGWILRPSSTMRGWRLHESSHDEATPDVREAIDRLMNDSEEATSE